jgi:hypothetical protein
MPRSFREAGGAGNSGAGKELRRASKTLAMTKLQDPLSLYEAPLPTALEAIAERHDCRLEFNVMPGRPVVETLHFKHYEVSADYARGTFDRTYASSMLASPSHLIFLTALVHLQKLLYMILCKRWGFAYDGSGPERLKIWPTNIEVKVPELIIEEHGLVQEAWLRELREVRAGRHRFVIETRIGSTMMVVSGVTFPL